MYRLSSAAERDIADILEYSLLNFGVDTAQRYVTALEGCFATLSDNPTFGRSAEDLRVGYRRHTHQSHTIFYLVEGADVVIQRVLHSSRDIENQLP